MSNDIDPAFAQFVETTLNEPFGAGKEPGEQGSVEWLMERVGHVTASRFKDVLDFTKAGKEGAKRIKYRTELVVELLTGRPFVHYVTNAMQDGIEREPAAKMAYEARTNAMVEERGFLHHPSMQGVGGSPDGLVGDDGGLECKCPTPGTHIDTLLTEDVSEYVAQCQGLMWITGRQWWDLCSYCPEMPDGLQTIIVRIARDDAYIATLDAAVRAFLREVQATVAVLQAKAKR